MPSDLNLLPLVRRAGQDQSNLPGLFASTAPRRTARGRASDRLILFLALSDTLSRSDSERTSFVPTPHPSLLSMEQQTQLLGQIAQKFYETPGSVTAAMRAVIESLNQNLLERNLRGSGPARQGAGLLSVVVEREGHLYLSHSGPMHTLLARADGVQHFYDPEGSGRGLGLSQNAPVRYFQTEFQPLDYLLLTPQLPEAWNIPNLNGTHGQGHESLRRRLVSQAGAELRAVLVQAMEGSGKMRLLWPKLPASKPAQAAESPTPAIEPAQTAAADLAQPTIPSAASPAPVPAGPEPSVEHQTDLAIAPIVEPRPLVQELPPLPSPHAADEDSLPEAIQGRVPAVESAPEAQPASLPLSAPENRPASAPTDTPGAGEAPIELTERPPIQRRVESQAAAQPALPQTSPQVLPRSDDSVAPVTGSPAYGPQPTLRPAARQIDQEARPAPAPRRRRERQQFSLAPLMARFAPIGQAVGATLLRVGRSLGALFKSMLPDETLLRIPPGTMLLVAVGVAVVLSTAGAIIYLNRGRAAQHQIYYDQALQLAGQAQNQTDPIQQHASWEMTLAELDKAEYYGQTEQSTLLRGLAQNALDQLDGVRRIDFQPAIINGLSKTIPVTRLAASARDLYLLDGAQGNVMRAILTNIGYGVDATFRCAPGALGGQVVGSFVDIAALPEGNQFDATVMGMDQAAHLIYCIPHDNPIATSLATPLDTGWGEPAAFALDSNNLFVLDTEKKKVWVYQGMETSQSPYSFFDEAIDAVPNLQDVVDMAVNRSELYLLHADGRLTQCTLGRIEQERTRCTSPVIFADNRPGRQYSEKIADAHFTQVFYAPPPDPSIYLLDADHQALYHFGLQLTLYGQYRSQNQSPEGAATAFTISPDRVAFIAVSHQVFYSKLP